MPIDVASLAELFREFFLEYSAIISITKTLKEIKILYGFAYRTNDNMGP